MTVIDQELTDAQRVVRAVKRCGLFSSLVEVIGEEVAGLADRSPLDSDDDEIVAWAAEVDQVWDSLIGVRGIAHEDRDDAEMAA